MSSVLKVLNVGQGDSSIITIQDGCKYADYDIFIDVGNGLGVKDVSNVGRSTNQILILSHAHEDHIGGLSRFISTSGISGGLKEIWMPLFFEEISIITEKILQLRGIQHVSMQNGAYLSAKNAVSSFHMLRTLSAHTRIKMRGMFEGKRSCAHFQVYHPPIDPAWCLGISQAQVQDYIRELEESNYAEIRSWFHVEAYSSQIIRFLRSGNPDFREINREDDGFSGTTFFSPNDEIPVNVRTNFSHGLLLSLRKLIAQFIEKPGDKSLQQMYDALKKTSNDCSIVFKYLNHNLDVLFTGDIGKNILDHLTKKHGLKAAILKVPHHGSKRNLSISTLKSIGPKYAIISHNNGRFGRQKDPHPNQEVIDMMNQLKINAIYTNDVIKNNVTIVQKPARVNVGPSLEYYDTY